MKLALSTDFTALPRAGSIARADGAVPIPFEVAVLPHDERHLRRRVIELVHGDRVLVDLAETTMLESGDRLVLDDGRQVEIIAAEEPLYEVGATDPVHLAELAWHIGNRHLAASIEPTRILILRDHVLREMLEGLGATVVEVTEPFQPLRGAYSGQAHGHRHHGEEERERDRFGRLPDDPHYGHDHG